MQYLIWHFVEMPKHIFQAWTNLLRFSIDYFSLPILLKTFFSPWKKFSHSYGKSFSFKKYFEVFVFNLMSRTIGAVIRLFFVLLALVFSFFVFISGLFFLLAWILMPLWLVYIFLYGINLI